MSNTVLSEEHNVNSKTHQLKAIFNECFFYKLILTYLPLQTWRLSEHTSIPSDLDVLHMLVAGLDLNEFACYILDWTTLERPQCSQETLRGLHHENILVLFSYFSSLTFE